MNKNKSIPVFMPHHLKVSLSIRKQVTINGEEQILEQDELNEESNPEIAEYKFINESLLSLFNHYLKEKQDKMNQIGQLNEKLLNYKQMAYEEKSSKIKETQEMQEAKSRKENLQAEYNEKADIVKQLSSIAKELTKKEIKIKQPLIDRSFKKMLSTTSSQKNLGQYSPTKIGRKDSMVGVIKIENDKNKNKMSQETKLNNILNELKEIDEDSGSASESIDHERTSAVRLNPDSDDSNLNAEFSPTSQYSKILKKNTLNRNVEFEENPYLPDYFGKEKKHDVEV
mmetsp:Transcript_31414/g.27758  ORF Transcript_31414/g.27758 Transcript_31414/m.27758 type:complete len:284 (+) Transcript_31414:789-1640(+)